MAVGKISHGDGNKYGRNGPYGLFNGMVEMIQSYNSAPTKTLSYSDQGHDGNGETLCARMTVNLAKMEQKQRDLTCERNLCDGGSAPPQEDGREQRVEQTVPFEIDPREEGPVGANKDVYSRKHEVIVLVGVGFVQIGMAEGGVAVAPKRDVEEGDGGENGPPEESVVGHID